VPGDIVEYDSYDNLTVYKARVSKRVTGWPCFVREGIGVELTVCWTAQGLSEQCCGMIFSSKGFKAATATKGAALEAALLKASEGGKLPIVCDTSPCLAQIKGDLTDGALKCAPSPRPHTTRP
jgi:hypothetical protein